MTAVGNSIRILSTNSTKVELFKYNKSRLLGNRRDDNLMKLFNKIYDAIELSNFDDYSRAVFFQEGDTKHKFDLIKIDSLQTIKRWLVGEEGASYTLLNILFYSLISCKKEIDGYCFLYPAYKIDNKTLYLILNHPRLKGYFSDEFLFTKSESLTIYKGGQDLFENFYLQADEARSFHSEMMLFFEECQYLDGKQVIIYELFQREEGVISSDIDFIIQRHL